MNNNYPVNLPITVIMPTYNQCAFISRAIKSLLLQSYSAWELVIINDGSTDYTEEVIGEHLSDGRIRYLKNTKNEGMGFCLNQGLNAAKFSLISYLPSDDIFFSDHLQILSNLICSNRDCILAHSDLQYDLGPNSSTSSKERGAKINGYFQLVQVLHRKTNERWITRDTLVTDDLDVMFWNKLVDRGEFLPTNKVTCEWVNHPQQRHKIIKETSYGGIRKYKMSYNVSEPIRFQSSTGSLTDEIQFFQRFRGIPKTVDQSFPERKLKILIVGELAYNAERIYALEEYGHRLYAIWTPSPLFYNTIGPLPFGNVEDIPISNWKKRVDEIKPDIIYALLNTQAIAIAHYILSNNSTIPFVWHFKEGPFYAQQFGQWRQLLELYVNSDGQIFINEETRNWFLQFLIIDTPVYILDGDLPKKEWITTNKTPRLLSQMDGEIHTVVSGRPIGLNAPELSYLSNQKIHIHVYGEYYHSAWKEWVGMAQETAGKFVHLHPNCSADKWASEFSQYDAGWLHLFNSTNQGEIMKMTWDDLNFPARMSTLAVSGIPLIMKSNPQSIVASENYLTKLDIGICFTHLDNLKEILSDRERMKKLRSNMWQVKDLFSFDHHVEELTSFFLKVIDNYNG